jgi:hypothetical protein
MNISGGAKRIRKAGRYCLLASLAVFVLLVGVVAVALLWPSLGISFALLDVALLPLLLAVPGATLWLIGWIVEGFSDNNIEDQVRT